MKELIKVIFEILFFLLVSVPIAMVLLGIVHFVSLFKRQKPLTKH
jgi:hypothetical protein